MLNRTCSAVALAAAFLSSAVAFDIKSSPPPGNPPALTSAGEIGINRADGRLYYMSEGGAVMGGLLPDLNADGYLKFRSGLTLGRSQGSKFISQPNNVQIQGLGSTGAISEMGAALPLSGGIFRSFKERFADRPNVRDIGAVCDGVQDAGPLINTMIAMGVKSLSIPRDGNCRSSATINVVNGTILEGLAFSPGNPASGSTITCDAGVSPCVRVGNGQQLFGNGLRRLVVKRAGGKPAANLVGVLIDQDYNPTLEDVAVYNHGQGYRWYGSNVNGLGGMYTRLFSGAISDAHVVQDGWPELRITLSRFGMNGPGDYNANTYFRTQGGSPGTASGPNGLTVQNSQLNQGGAPTKHVFEFVELAAPLPQVDAAIHYFDNLHVENVSDAIFYSDATWNVLSRGHFNNSSINAPGAKFLDLNPATAFDDFAFIGVHGNVKDVTYAPAGQTNRLRFIGNRFDGPASFTAGAGGGSTTALIGNTFGGNLTLAGQWGSLNVLGNQWTAGGLVNNAAGNVAVFDAVSGLKTGGSPETKSVVLYGVTDASGAAALPHGIGSATRVVVGVSAVVRDAGGAAIVVSNARTSSPSYAVVDGTNVNLRLTSTYPNARVRVKVDYVPVIDPNWP